MALYLQLRFITIFLNHTTCDADAHAGVTDGAL